MRRSPNLDAAVQTEDRPDVARLVPPHANMRKVGKTIIGYPNSLFRTLNLPGLQGGDAPFFTPLNGSRPDEVLRNINKLATAAASAIPTQPAERTRYTLVGKYDLEAEAARPKVAPPAAPQV